MSDESRKPLREHVTEKVAALAALRSIAEVATRTEAAGGTLTADYQTVLEQLEREVVQALAAAAIELRKPTLGALVDRLWESGPLTFRQIHAAVAEAGAPSGEIETLLNRFRNAGLLHSSGGPTPETDAVQQRAKTLPPTNILPDEDTVVLAPKHPVAAAAAAEPEVTATYSQLVTAEGRAWFNARALAHGIDLGERIHCQF